MLLELSESQTRQQLDGMSRSGFLVEAARNAMHA